MRPGSPEAQSLARHFHETYDRRFPRGDGPTAWDDMPESYQLRLQNVFDWMLRDGTIAAGPMLRDGTLALSLLDP